MRTEKEKIPQLLVGRNKWEKREEREYKKLKTEKRMEAIMKEVEKVTAFRLLPSGLTRASANENPRLMMLYGEPKAGKSTVCLMIPGALVIDLAEEL